MTVLLLFLTGLLAGSFGALLGLGGGLIVVPVLTMLFHLPIHTAIGVSIVGVIATSTGAALVYVRKGQADLRLGMLLELATTIGAITGAALVEYISAGVLYLLFAMMLLYNAYSMYRRGEGSEVAAARQNRVDGTVSADDDTNNDGGDSYTIRNVPQGFSLSIVAGVLSGLLGVGGGIIKIPVMYLLMGVPLKVATVTSNFMIGITAAASGFIYFLNGRIIPPVAVPVALGILIGAVAGAWANTVVPARTLKRIFVFVMLYVALQMIVKGMRG